MTGKPHSAMDIDEALSAMGSSREGLNGPQAARILAAEGPNELAAQRSEPRWIIFLKQFKDPLVIVLLAAAAVTALIEPGGFDWAVIGAIVLINAIIGYVQEEKAKEAMAKLKEMASPKAIVIREGVRSEIDSSDLVRGDLVHLESGTRVPADLRLIEEVNIVLNEAALTGESLPVEKDTSPLPEGTPLAERANMAFMGSTVESGRGVGLVTAVGMGTELGRIAGMLQEAPREDTPLQVRLRKLGKRLGVLVISASVLIFALEVIRSLGDLSGGALVEMFKAAVALAVAAIPEGLPTVVTISLALGIRSMAKRNAVVRKLPVVETLGSATVICTDKTGTLTQGIMAVDWAYAGGRVLSIEGEGYSPEGRVLENGSEVASPMGDPALRCMLEGAVLCSDAVMRSDQGRWSIVGDTTEGALLVMAARAGLDIERTRSSCPRTDEIPFDPKRKMMSTVNEVGGSAIAFSKGAPERILRCCTREYTKGSEAPLAESRVRAILAQTDSKAREGYRTLAIACSHEGRMEEDMTFLGIAGIRDQIRPEAREAIAKAHGAGVRVVMITGDHHLTAASIGRDLGLISGEEQSMNCSELDPLEGEAFRSRLKEVSVYARASPEHKVRIVKGLRESGEIVAMTGDGVNDAPALKNADIGIAMGITGTDVTKEASDMVLADDNFSTIVSAVEEGRTIYSNIRKAIQFLLSCNMGEVLVMLIAIAVGWPLPLLAIQILWMNLVTDSLPALALVTEPMEPDVMKRPPRKPTEGALTREMIVSIIVSAIIITIGSLVMFRLAIPQGIETARTVTLVTMVLFQMWTAVSARSTTHSMAAIGWFTNRNLLLAIGAAVLLIVPLIYVPFLQDLFGTAPLGIMEWAIVVIVSSLGLVAVEAWELVNRRYLKWS